MSEQQRTCKYCGKPIAHNYFCCRACFDLFEVGPEEDTDEEKKEENE